MNFFDNSSETLPFSSPFSPCLKIVLLRTDAPLMLGLILCSGLFRDPENLLFIEA